MNVALDPERSDARTMFDDAETTTSDFDAIKCTDELVY